MLGQIDDPIKRIDHVDGGAQGMRLVRNLVHDGETE
jgi:hypothetical protein